MIDDNNFENPYWNLIQTLTWMYTRENDSITKEEASHKVLAEIQKRFVPSDLAVVITLPDEDKYDALERDALSSELTERLKQQTGASNWFDSLEKELINALRCGEIKCFGINSNSVKTEEITAKEWHGLKFYYGISTLQAGPKYCTLGTRWYRLEFPAESITKVFPTPSVSSTIKDEAACQSWLEELMSNSSQQEENKSYYQKQALSKFNTGTKAFNRAWANAIVKTGNTNWGKPGRKKSQP